MIMEKDLGLQFIVGTLPSLGEMIIGVANN